MTPIAFFLMLTASSTDAVELRFAPVCSKIFRAAELKRPLLALSPLLATLIWPVEGSAQVKAGLCSGPPNSSERIASQYLKQSLQSDGLFQMEVFATTGGTENLNLLRRGVCQMALVPKDVFNWYLRHPQPTDLYSLRRKENAYTLHVGMVCHRRLAIQHIGELPGRADTVIYAGSPDSKSAYVMKTLSLLRENYQSLHLVHENGNPQSDLEEARHSIEQASAQNGCAVWTRNPNDPELDATLARFRKEVNIVSMSDPEYTDPTKPPGDTLYPLIPYSELQVDLAAKLLPEKKPDDANASSEAWAFELKLEVVVNDGWEKQVIEEGQGIETVSGDGKKAEPKDVKAQWERVLQKFVSLEGKFPSKRKLAVLPAQEPPRSPPPSPRSFTPPAER